MGPQNITANVHCLDDNLPFVTPFLVLAGTATQNQPDAVLEFFNIEVAGCCATQTQSMAIELVSDDCVELGTCTSLLIGSNSLGGTAPSYLSADDCGILEPTPLFPEMMLAFVVNGVDESEDGLGETGEQEAKLLPAEGATNDFVSA